MAFEVGPSNRIKLSSIFTHLLNKCHYAAANVVEEHTFNKCSRNAIGDYVFRVVVINQD